MVLTGIIVTGFNNLYYQNTINQGLIVMFLACIVSVTPDFKQVTANICIIGVILSIFISNVYF
jgi:3-isopropylmalate dehydratase small subunit